VLAGTATSIFESSLLDASHIKGFLAISLRSSSGLISEANIVEEQRHRSAALNITWIAAVEWIRKGINSLDMTAERKILLAIDASEQAEPAFNCEYGIPVAIWYVF
jgi:hypothetical protein